MDYVTSTSSGASQNLFVEARETVLLSPDSKRFGPFYQRVHPRTIDDVREVVGLTDASARALRDRGGCCASAAAGVLYSPGDLSSDDPNVSRLAKEVAARAARQYVLGSNPLALEQWKPLINRYLEMGKVAITFIALRDIEISEGGTLLISSNTMALFANSIKIHGSGRIRCQGDISIKCTSLQGINPANASISTVASHVNFS